MSWNLFARKTPPEPSPALTAAAQIVAAPRPPLLKTPDSWQREVWDFYDSLGEFNYGVTWLSQMLGRVRLRAARLDPGLDEPSIDDVPPDSLAAKMLRDLAGGVGGQSQMLKNLVIQLSAPGEGYLVGEQLGKSFSWMVRSQEEVRATNGKFQVVGNRIPNVDWVDLPENSLVVRVWKPHPRWYHVADSPARSALPIMRELELVNRYIVAQYLSRLAMAGLLILPEEASFPVREEFQDEPDPLSMEFVQIAAESIAEPGHASAIVPLLIRVPAELAEKIKHIDFTLKIDEKVIERRNSAITRLANKLDIPAEVLTGLGDVNHWTAWQLDEGALKTHIAPMAELICHCLTTGYLQPRLAASGEEDVGQWVVWYDMSELAIRPDRSENALQAYDRLELSGVALRRELGFDEDDKPDDDELKEQALKVIIHTLPSGAASALSQLVEEEITPIVPVSPQDPGTAEETAKGNTPPPADKAPPDKGDTPPTSSETSAPDKEKTGPPGDGKGAPPPPDEDVKATLRKAQLEHLVAQTKILHAVRFTGTRAPVLMHPPLCMENAYGCPFTHAAEEAHITRLSTGTYEARLDAFGRFMVGQEVPWLDTTGWITTGTTVLSRRTNGHARS